MDLVSFWTIQHHASSISVLIRSVIYLEDLLVHVLLYDCRCFTISLLNPFHCLDIIRRPSYFGCIGVSEFYYKVSKGLPIECRSGAIVHAELP